MARLARAVIPDVPHHVTQRGNRRAPIFFQEGDDQRVYMSLLAEQAKKARVSVWAYCLMPNHVHLIMTPSDEEGLGRAIGEAHRRYTSFINNRAGWTGHLFQRRFGSVPMDEAHLVAAARYVALNPVRAGLVAHARDWPWSSVRAHLEGADDRLVQVKPLLDRVGDFAELLTGEPDRPEFQLLRRAESTGRPLGSDDFVADLESRLGRRLTPGRRGRRARTPEPDQPGLWA